MPATSRGTRRALAIAGTAALASAALPALPIYVPELYHLDGNSTALNATALNATALNVTALNATALKATALRPLPRVVAPHVGVALPGAVALHAPGRPLAAVAPLAPLTPGVMGWRVYCMAWVWAALMGMNPASLSYTQPPTMTPTGSSDGASFAQIMLIVWFWFLWVATPALQIPLLVFMLLFTLAKKMFCPFFVFLIWFIIAAASSG